MSEGRRPISDASAWPLAQLRELARSPQPPHRWEAGRVLAVRVGQPDAGQAERLLHRLLLESDTALARRICQRLARDADPPSARALSSGGT